MTTIRKLVRDARRVFPETNYTDPDQVRHLRRGWIRSRLRLGERTMLNGRQFDRGPTVLASGVT